MASIFIDGAAGTTGLEIRERLSQRPTLDLVILDEADRKDPEARRAAIERADVTILCLPDDAARDAVAMASADARFIDASSAHRTHPDWTYGFAELTPDRRAAIADARLLSNPGCYPTGFLALVAPLVARGLLKADWPFSVNAVSGYSGGGNAMIARFEQPDAPAFRSYGLSLEHKHLAEMQMQAGLTDLPIFSPGVVPGFRGMIVEVPVPAAAMTTDGSPRAFSEALAEHFAGEPLITVHQDSDADELLVARAEQPSDRLDLFVFASNDGRRTRLIAMLDNLGKGASGAAVQNLNLMIGAPETEGLRL